jgi:putative sterol carrier protein
VDEDRGADVPEKYQFLTDEWIAEAKRIRSELEGEAAAVAHQVRMNQVVTEVPFGEGTVQAHMDTTDGEMKMDLGHVENPDLTVTLDYATAKAILVDGNPQAGMQAFMNGKIKVDGDISKLMAMQTATPHPAAAEVARRIQEITAD